MSKKLKNLKWETVALEGIPASVTEDLNGFIGLEVCNNYGLDKNNKNSKKKKPQKKRKNTSTEDSLQPTKKVKLSNGFIVENCDTVNPSTTNEESTIPQKNERSKLNKKQNVDNTRKVIAIENVKNKKNKIKLGEDISESVSTLTPEDMLTWAEFKLPEPIMKALAELGFIKPTKIQELTLPAAIHGRRDILGAAETGSGKTLAFGLPILTGILKLKEKAEAGFDVYEIPYKKTSTKKKDPGPVIPKKKGRNKKKEVPKPKESSEDGYSSGESEEKSDDANQKQNSKTEDSEEEYLEEIEVPIRKRETSVDEGNNSDDSDNYIHLSEMLDSDDLADSSDDDQNKNADDGAADTDGEENDSEEAEGSDNEGDSDTATIDEEQDSHEEQSGSDNESVEEMDGVSEDNTGIGCVKVIDNIEIPGHTVTKTGKPLYALILTPTRELAIQISRHLTAAAKYTGIRIATLVGGLASVKQERVLRSGPEVVVATPGRLWELVCQGERHLQQLDCVKFLAIDETDRMVERGHFEELYPLLERLNADDAKRSSRQNFVFSATLTMVHELPAHMRGKKVTKRGKIINRKIEKMTPQQKIKKLVNMIGMTEPKVVDITTKNLGTAETLTESRIACSLDQKDAHLYYILRYHPGRTIVFCNSIGCVKRLTQLFTILKCHPLPLHANMPQRQRLKNLERFRDDPRGVLVATDVAARGLDIPDVDHVIHYQVPRTAENYVHRSGRTARANKEGLTILMMEPAEAYLYAKLCRTLNKTSEVPVFPVPGSALGPLRDLVNLARDIDALELKRRKTNQDIGWREKVAREMDIIVDEDDIPSKQSDPAIEKALKAKRRDFERALARPLLPVGFSGKYPTLNAPPPPNSGENALQVMKKAIESGELKKEKRKSKNAPLLKLEKTFKKK